jgi:Mg/Co/Ni transporter MgtE
MDYNVGPEERRVRFTLGGVLLVFAVGALLAYFSGVWTATQTTVGIVAATAMVLSAVMFVTGQAQKCPVNAAVGRNSYRRD